MISDICKFCGDKLQFIANNDYYHKLICFNKKCLSYRFKDYYQLLIYKNIIVSELIFIDKFKVVNQFFSCHVNNKWIGDFYIDSECKLKTYLLFL